MKKFLLFQIAVFFLSAGLLSQQSRIIYSPLSDSMTGSLDISADSVYSFISGKEHLIDFYDCNICKSRAHIISRAIEKKFSGITVYKAWLIANSKRNSQKEIYRYKQNTYLNYGSCSNWVYHVAPVILINGDTVVIDPATQKTTVTLSKWAGDIIPESGTGYLIIKKYEYYLYPETDDDYFMDELNDWNTGERRIKDEKYLRSIDEILSVKHGFFEPWRFNYYMSELLKLVE